MEPVSVEEHLHPQATGATTELALAHSAEHPLKLYSNWVYPFVQRAWIVLKEKRIPYQYIAINPYEKTEFLLSGDIIIHRQFSNFVLVL